MPKGAIPNQAAKARSRAEMQEAAKQRREKRFDPFAPLSQAGNIIGGAFTSLGQMLSQTPEIKGLAGFLNAHPAPIGGNPSPYQPQPFYQVKASDTSMADIAARHNLPLQYLTDLNKAKTLPPKGSYIQLAPQPGSLNATLGMNANANPFAGNRQVALPDREGRGDPAAQALRNQAQTIMRQLASGMPPAQIPAAALGFIKNANGEPLTIQTAMQMGYTMNAQGVLVNPAAAGGGGGGEGKTVYYSKSRGWVTPEVARLLNRKRRRRQYEGRQDVLAPVPELPATTEGPQTILDIHLGSG